MVEGETIYEFDESGIEILGAWRKTSAIEGLHESGSRG